MTSLAPSPSDERSDLRPLALVVDDFADGRDIAVCVLESLGFRTAQAANGHDALERAREHLPDLVVLDLALPGIDGWEVARRLRAQPLTAGAAILGYTAHAERSSLERARAAGCDEVLTKPCPPKDLAERVRRLMRHRAGIERRRENV